MDGENNGLFHGKPYEQMDDLLGFPIIFGFNTHLVSRDLFSISITAGLLVCPIGPLVCRMYTVMGEKH